MILYNVYNICWLEDKHMAVYGRLGVVSMDHEVWVYKVDNPVQSSLSSFLVLTQYKVYLLVQL